jgi:hypothetical protein
MKARLKLNRLRDEGVQIRIDGIRLNDRGAVQAWEDEVQRWNRSVIAAVEQIDEADARQLATLDFPGDPRQHLPAYLSFAHRHFYVLHDRRQVRLEEYLTRLSDAVKGIG